MTDLPARIRIERPQPKGAPETKHTVLSIDIDRADADDIIHAKNALRTHRLRQDWHQEQDSERRRLTTYARAIKTGTAVSLAATTYGTIELVKATSLFTPPLQEMDTIKHEIVGSTFLACGLAIGILTNFVYRYRKRLSANVHDITVRDQKTDIAVFERLSQRENELRND